MHHLESPWLRGRHASDGTPLAYTELVAAETRDELTSCHLRAESQVNAAHSNGRSNALAVIKQCCR